MTVATRRQANRRSRRPTRPTCGSETLTSLLEQQFAPDPGDDPVQPFTRLQVREHERLPAAHEARVALHDAEVGADVRRQIDLVDHQQVRARDARTTLARNLVAARDVDDVDRRVRQFRAEAGREIVAAALDEHQLQLRKPAIQLIQRLETDRRVLANRRVRASAGLDADDAIGGERLAAGEELHVLLREDVVGHDRELIVVAHGLAQTVEQGGLAGSYGAADADTNGFAHGVGCQLPVTSCQLPVTSGVNGAAESGRALLIVVNWPLATGYERNSRLYKWRWFI